MISSEAMHKGVTKVKQATPKSALSDRDEIMIQAKGEGITIIRQTSETYSEFFLYCSVKEEGVIVVHPDGLKFLEHSVGDKVFFMKGKELKTNDNDSIKTVSSGDYDYYSRKEPTTEFCVMPPVIKKILWSNDPDDLVVGHIFFSGKYMATTDRTNFSLVHLKNKLPLSAIFPTKAILAFKDEKEDYFVTVDDSRVWFKKGKFLSGTQIVGVANKMPNHFEIISKVEVETMPYFSIDKGEFTRVIDQVITHATSPVFNGTCRCYLNLREDGSLYIESNWSDNGQIKRELRTKSTLTKEDGTTEGFEVSVTGQYLKQAINQLDGDEVNFIMADMIGQRWPMIVEDGNRFVLGQTDLGWRQQNETQT